MLGRPALPLGFRPISKRLSVLSGGFLVAVAGACSAGESGLVLGRPLPQLQGGEPGGMEGVAGEGVGGVGGTGGSGVVGPRPEAGASGGGADGGAGEAGTGSWVDEQCSPTITYDNRDTTSKGQLFRDAVPEPALVVWAAARDACRLLYRSASEVKPVSNITLIVEDYPGVAGTSGTTLRLSTSYLQARYDGGSDLSQEIAGILHFTTSLVYQYNGGDTAPGWLMTGIADFVRLESGFIDRSERAKGGNYDSSSKTTAFFLDYLTTRRPSVVYELNLGLSPGEPAYTSDVFVSLMGNDLDALWAQYQATL